MTSHPENGATMNTTHDPRKCCAACVEYDDYEDTCRYPYCECHDWSVNIDGNPPAKEAA